MKYKRGTIREDGFMFWRESKGKEIWLTLEDFEKKKIEFKEYAKKRYLANKDKVIANSKKWRENNKEKYLELSRVWQKAKYRKLHPPKPIITEAQKAKKLEIKKQQARERSKRWRIKNKEKHRAYSLNWAKENPDIVNKRNKLWKQQNPERYKEFQRKYNLSVPEKKRKNAATRRCKKKNQSPILNENQKKIIDCFYKQSERLTKRFGFQFEVDHIIPVARGGAHEPSNLQVLPKKINRAKGCKNIFKWQDYHSPSSSVA